jgi:hypothetical protein
MLYKTSLQGDDGRWNEAGAGMMCRGTMEGGMRRWNDVTIALFEGVLLGCGWYKIERHGRRGGVNFVLQY